MQTIFKSIVGSQAYGTNIESSDTDFKGVYLQPPDDILGCNYKEQIEFSKDHVEYEVRRFVELLQSANPTVLELLFSPKDCVLQSAPAFDLILEQRHKFLTKKCEMSFGGYAVAQIRKARGLDKKMNWEGQKVEKKEPLDFCYFTPVVEDVGEMGKTFPLKDLVPNLNNIGLVKLDHLNAYAVYIGGEHDKFNGIFEKGSNHIITSSVPKERQPEAIAFFNKDSWAIYKKDWESYQTWLKERNSARYVDTQHGQKIDGKNLMHCRRLIDTALEIAETGNLQIRRENKKYLLQIRRGEVCLDKIIDEAEADIAKLKEAYQKSGLPDQVNLNIHELILSVRKHK